jgi:hypothetical protein
MDNQLAVVLVSTGGSVIIGLLGAKWKAANQLGKRQDSLLEKIM